MQRPWFQQFWPWFLIILPLCAVAASLYTFYIATKGADSMVVDDYYKKGKAINQDLGELRKAVELGLVAELRYHDDELILRLEGDHVQGEAIKLRFIHPTQAERDFGALLSSDANGSYRYRPEQTGLSGQWNARIEAFDGRWRLQKRVTLPIPDRLVIRAGG